MRTGAFAPAGGAACHENRRLRAGRRSRHAMRTGPFALASNPMSAFIGSLAL